MSVPKVEQSSALVSYAYRLQSANIVLDGLVSEKPRSREIESTRRAAEFIQVRSPATGFVLARNLLPGKELTGTLSF